MYVVENKVVRDYFLVDHTPITQVPTATFTGALQVFNQFDRETTNLWVFTFVTAKRITPWGSIQATLPKTHFAGLSTSCYKVWTAGITCKGQPNWSSTHHRILITNVAPGTTLLPAATFEI